MKFSRCCWLVKFWFRLSEVLEQVHVLLHEVVLSHSWEGEGLIVELPGVDGHLGVLSLLLQLVVDLHGVVIVLLIEISREVVKLDVQLFNRDLKGFFAVVNEGWWVLESFFNSEA